MGGNESKKSKSNTPAVGAKTNPPKGKMQSNIQHVLLLYKAEGKEQLDLVDAFQDALVLAGDPRIDILYDINIAEAGLSTVKDLEWLNQENNVILVRLSPDIMEDLERIIREKKFAGKDNVIHDKIVAVSFGKDFPQGWPPSGMTRRVCDHQKDFCFEFEDESLLPPGGFKSASAKSTMNAIVTSLLAVDDGKV